NAGDLVGIVTDRDLVTRGTARDIQPSAIRVSECMSPNVIAVRPEETVQSAMSIMARKQIGRLPVIDNKGKLIGVVTLSSLALSSSQQGNPLDAAQEVSRRSSRVA